MDHIVQEAIPLTELVFALMHEGMAVGAITIADTETTVTVTAPLRDAVGVEFDLTVPHANWWAYYASDRLNSPLEIHNRIYGMLARVFELLTNPGKITLKSTRDVGQEIVLQPAGHCLGVEHYHGAGMLCVDRVPVVLFFTLPIIMEQLKGCSLPLNQERSWWLHVTAVDNDWGLQFGADKIAEGTPAPIYVNAEQLKAALAIFQRVFMIVKPR